LRRALTIRPPKPRVSSRPSEIVVEASGMGAGVIVTSPVLKLVSVAPVTGRDFGRLKFTRSVPNGSAVGRAEVPALLRSANVNWSGDFN